MMFVILAAKTYMTQHRLLNIGRYIIHVYSMQANIKPLTIIYEIILINKQAYIYKITTGAKSAVFFHEFDEETTTDKKWQDFKQFVGKHLN